MQFQLPNIDGEIRPLGLSVLLETKYIYGRYVGILLSCINRMISSAASHYNRNQRDLIS
jgi:hypothetical protein